MKAIGLLALGFAMLAGCSERPEAPEARRAAAAPAVSVAAERVAASKPVIVYYFHGTVRCETCLKIENEARDFINSRFAAELAAGRLVFRSVNYDQPENAHFSKDYKLPCPSLVLVRPTDGRDPDWKLLGKTWDLIQVPPRLHQYIEEEICKFLETTLDSTISSPPREAGLGQALGSLSELRSLADEMNAVLAFVPAKGRRPSASALAAIDGARKTLEARFDIQVGLFELAPGSRDYEELAAQAPVPMVAVIVKTGVRRCVSGDLSADRIVDGFMRAVGAAGCCPLGYPAEK